MMQNSTKLKWIYISEYLKANNTKDVRDHCHFTGEYIIPWVESFPDAIIYGPKGTFLDSLKKRHLGS